MKPELTSARLRYVPYIAGRVTPQHIGWLNDPEVVQYSEQRHRKHTLETEHEYLNAYGPDDFIWLLKTDKKDIGSISATIDRNNRFAEMGILIGDKTEWGNGYGLEAWKTVMHWLFETEYMRKVECGTMMANRAMRKIATKSGMLLDGVRIQHFILEGRPQDLLLYGKLRP